MRQSVNSKIGSFVLVALALTVPSSVSAEEIALTFQEGGFTIYGEFAGFMQNAYVIQTEAGELRVPMALITCEGEACFEFSSPADSEG